MTDFAMSWDLSRQRFLNEISDLTDEQIKWRPFPTAHSIGEMAIHVAGVEVSFSSQLLGLELTPEQARIKASATEGVVNDNPFPFAEEEISTVFVLSKLEYAKSLVEPLITSPSSEVLEKQLKSALGPIITGKGALARFAFHPGYHQGQAYFYKTMPEFPKSHA